jgi:hypothetical protein
MNLFQDPPRLREIEDTPQQLRNWLQNARQDEQSIGEIEWLTQVVDGLGGTSQSGFYPGSAALPQAVRSAAMGTSTVWGPFLATLVIGVSAGLGIGSWLFQQDSGPSASISQLRGSIATSTRSEASDAVREATDATSSNAMGREHVMPVASPSAHARIPAQTLAVSLTPTTRSRSRAAAAPAPAAQPKAAAAPARAEESRILRAARHALSSDPSRALALTREHAQRFPEGMLDQEREFLAIEALARLGRPGEAMAQAQKFSSRFPASPYRSRNEAAISRSFKSGTKP